MSKTITLKVQQLGGQLVVYLPADIVEATQLIAGQPVTIHIPTSPEEIRNSENLALTLEQMLAQYDPEKFEAEMLATPLVGREKIK